MEKNSPSFLGPHGTFVLWRLGSIAFKLFAAIDLYSVNCGHVALYQSARRITEFENIGRNVVVASERGLVETGPTILVATALLHVDTPPYKWKARKAKSQFVIFRSIKELSITSSAQSSHWYWVLSRSNSPPEVCCPPGAFYFEAHCPLWSWLPPHLTHELYRQPWTKVVPAVTWNISSCHGAL